MHEILLLIAITYGVPLSLGHLLQKYLKMPWMFSALFFGMILSSLGLFKSSIESEPFQLLAKLGMLVILFIIGFNLDLKEIMRLRKQVFLGAIFIMGLEGLLGSLLFYFVFPDHIGNSFLMALIVSFSFATVGEAILLPILAEFNVAKTTFGQLTLGIGTVDDILEVLKLTVIVALPMFLQDTQVQGLPNPWLMLLTLGGMFVLTFAMTRNGKPIKKYFKKNSAKTNSTSSLIVPLVFCSFAALGGFVFDDLATVGAILSGIIARGMMPKKMLEEKRKK